MVKKGWTLAEILVSIAVIGVLAIIVIPLLTKDNPSRNKVIFRKSYNTLAQIVLNMINDDVNYPATRFDNSNPPIPRGFNYTVSAGSDNKFCSLIVNQLNTLGTVTCPSYVTPLAAANIATTHIFDMPDGSAWYIRLGGNDADPPAATGANGQFPMPPTAEASMYPTNITIDIDGPNKGSNCSADGYFSSTYPSYMPSGGSPPYKNCTNSDADAATNPCKYNPDTFILGVRYDGKIRVGTAGVDNCAIDILKNPTNNAK